MLHSHTLTLEGTGIDVTFGIIDDDPHALEQAYRQRYRVYHKYGYIDAHRFPDERDEDANDTPNKSAHIAAFRGNRMIGSVRLIHTTPLPVRRFFSFEIPPVLAHFSEDTYIEVSRLVVERTAEDKEIPRNIIMLAMMQVAFAYAHEQGSTVMLSYIKRRLLRKLALLRAPITEIDTALCTYPRDGSMAAYFYAQPNNPAVPSYMTLEEADVFIRGIFDNTHIFSHMSPAHTVLRHTMYNKFLKKLGIL